MFSRNNSRLVVAVALVATMLLATPAFAGGGKEPPAPAGKKTFSMVFIPKLIGIPWFTAMENGFKDYCAKEGVSFSMVGAPDPDPTAQARILEDTIAKHPDAIIVVPNDTRVVDPIMKKGLDAGILMITQEAPSVKNANADIEIIILEQQAKDMMELFTKHAGTKGGYAIMVGGLTVESHNQRADAIVKYQKEHYPDLYQVTSRLEGSESVQASHDRTLEVITAYPDVLGMIYIGSQGGVGAAQVVAEKHLKGKFTVTAEVTPNQSKRYLADGTMTTNYTSNPFLIGKDTAYVVHSLLQGKSLADVVPLPDYPGSKLEGKTITFESEMEVTLDNVDSFGF